MLTFIRWLALFSILGVAAGAVVGVVFGTDFDSSRRVGEIAGLFIWPTVLLASIIATAISRARKRKQKAAGT
ncbi:hypothetical protein EIP75_23625 [Aquabacterium soli]|uniref:Uncharacterized protein n=1 Tax=Aquabacterium soli TaxID=2493092 RepID=A0A426UZA9_9BURK|nr:hypothetical protein [Aquabacterium soli]RRR99901.1 hypothetical protein EIP75_23625 [Aquabacterium soli]